MGVPVDREQTDLSNADFEKGVGSLKLVGSLSLDYVRVRCVAEIDLESLIGHGHLERLSE